MTYTPYTFNDRYNVYGYKWQICNHQVFCKFLKLFFKDLLLIFDKLTAEIGPNFYSDSLKNFLQVFKFSFDAQIILFKDLSVISSALILYCAS